LPTTGGLIVKTLGAATAAEAKLNRSAATMAMRHLVDMIFSPGLICGSNNRSSDRPSPSRRSPHVDTEETGENAGFIPQYRQRSRNHHAIMTTPRNKLSAVRNHIEVTMTSK
jgi:hypothetical protein